MKARAFTLIELLVVIAIIAMLLAVLTPALHRAKDLAVSTIDLANLRGLSTAYYSYSQDHDSKLPLAEVGRNTWVEVPQDAAGNATNHNSTLEEKWEGIRRGTLFPYVDTVKVFHCPGDKRYLTPVGSRGVGAYRSFSVPGGANGGWDSTTLVTMTNGMRLRGVDKMSDIVNPGERYIFVEEAYTHTSIGTPTSQPMNAGFNTGDWDMFSGNVHTAWWDPLATWHNNRGTLGYADGHAEKWPWRDERTLQFAKDRSSISPDQPGNPDQEYMARNFPSRQSRQ